MISQIFDAKTAATRMKIDPYCQRQNCSPPNVFFSDVWITLILLIGVPLLESTIRKQSAKIAIATFNVYMR